MGLCCVCNKDIDNFDSIKCDGPCGKNYHVTVCAGKGVTPTFVKSKQENYRIKFYCSVCQNDKLVAIAHHLNNIEKMMELLDGRSQKQQNELDELRKLCSNNHETSTKEIQSTEKEIKDTIQGDTQKIQDDLKKMSENVKSIKDEMKNTKPSEKKVKTFAEIMQSSAKSTVILKPKKSDQSSSTTKTELQKKISPADIAVSNMRNISRGGIIIECKDKEASDKLIKKVTENLSENYEIKESSTIKPKVRIVGLREKETEENLLNYIRTQNAGLENADIKVINYVENKQKNGFSVILQVDGEIFQNLMKTQKIFVGWQRCSVYECIGILRCYNCSGFHHKAGECKNNKSCPRCSQMHELKECDKTDLCCPNCKYAVDTYKLKLNTDHEAWSHECPTYLKKLDMQRGKIAYNQQ